MNFIRIRNRNDRFLKIAWELYEESFPKLEQRAFEDHCKALDDEKFHCRVYLDNADDADDADSATLLGLLFYWDINDKRFVEFFAINPQKRGLGLGSKILQSFVAEEKSMVLLEIEVICDQVTEKRWNFYERLNFVQNDGVYVHPPYMEGYPPHELIILSYKNKLTPQEYNDFIKIDKKHILQYAFKTIV